MTYKRYLIRLVIGSIRLNYINPSSLQHSYIIREFTKLRVNIIMAFIFWSSGFVQIAKQSETSLYPENMRTSISAFSSSCDQTIIIPRYNVHINILRFPDTSYFHTSGVGIVSSRNCCLRS
jgi:hypothetical protein